MTHFEIMLSVFGNLLERVLCLYMHSCLWISGGHCAVSCNLTSTQGHINRLI